MENLLMPLLLPGIVSRHKLTSNQMLVIFRTLLYLPKQQPLKQQQPLLEQTTPIKLQQIQLQ